MAPTNMRINAATAPMIAIVCAAIPPANLQVSRASNAVRAALNWSVVKWSPCSAAWRTAAVIASAWAGVKSAAVSERATA